jgi:hypothetical protein
VQNLSTRNKASDPVVPVTFFDEYINRKVAVYYHPMIMSTVRSEFESTDEWRVKVVALTAIQTSDHKPKSEVRVHNDYLAQLLINAIRFTLEFLSDPKHHPKVIDAAYLTYLLEHDQANFEPRLTTEQIHRIIEICCDKLPLLDDSEV